MPLGNPAAVGGVGGFRACVDAVKDAGPGGVRELGDRGVGRAGPGENLALGEGGGSGSAGQRGQQQQVACHRLALWRPAADS